MEKPIEDMTADEVTASLINGEIRERDKQRARAKAGETVVLAEGTRMEFEGYPGGLVRHFIEGDDSVAFMGDHIKGNRRLYCPLGYSWPSTLGKLL